MRCFWKFMLVLPLGLTPTVVQAEKNPFSRPAKRTATAPATTVQDGVAVRDGIATVGLIEQLTGQPLGGETVARPVVAPSVVLAPPADFVAMLPQPPIERQLPDDEAAGEGADGEGADDQQSELDLLDDPMPDTGRPLAAEPSIYGENRIARVAGNRLQLPGFIVPTISTSGIGTEKLPENLAGNQLTTTIPLLEGPDRYADWSLTAYFWQAPNTYSHPLYFEDVMLERHGHERFPKLTPLLSGARFFATVPALPYLMAINPACDYDYHLGYYRPGTRAPALLQRPPYERRAAIIQGAATATGILIFP